MSRLLGISLTVPDLEAAVRFYGEALHFDVEAPARLEAPALAVALGLPNVTVRRAVLRLGAQRLELLGFDPPGRSYPFDSTASDLWFQHVAIVVSDMAAAYRHIATFPVRPITQGGPQRLPPNTGAVTAWKFRDPFGHPLELLSFPDGVGHPSWHGSNRPLFQGIDHTAVAVSDASRSIAFYERDFGFAVSSRTHNHGPKQSRLDGLEAADVDVVGLSPATEPPHLELLAYRGEQRPRPGDWTSADVAVSRTLIERPDAQVAVRPTASGTELRNGAGAIRAKRLRLCSDPDGHLICLDQR